MAKVETILLFIAGLVLTVVGELFWVRDLIFIPSLFAAGVLFSVINESRELLKEVIGHTAFDAKLVEDGEFPDYGDFNSNFVKVITAVILALTLYSL